MFARGSTNSVHLKKKSNSYGFSILIPISCLSISISWGFVSSLEGNGVEIKDAFFMKIERLFEKFGFDEFAAKLSELRCLMELKEAEDADAPVRIAVLEENAEQHDPEIPELQSELEHPSRCSALKGQIAAMPTDATTWESDASPALSAEAAPPVRSVAPFGNHW
jgi:hypothetical protein